MTQMQRDPGTPMHSLCAKYLAGRNKQITPTTHKDPMGQMGHPYSCNVDRAKVQKE